MKKILKIVLTLVITVICVMSRSVVSMANYDGQVMDNPYGDGGYDNSYGDTEYYDCFIPYAMTNEEIGGYATSSVITSSSDYSEAIMTESSKKTHVGLYPNREFGHNRVNNECSIRFGSNFDYTFEDDEDGMCLLVDPNGAKYYMAATGSFFYHYKPEGSDEEDPFNVITGMIFDVILTDNTIIHFVKADGIGDGHSNGGENAGGGGQDGISYGKAPLNYPQYKNLFHAQTGNMLEMICEDGALSSFFEKYNIGDEEGQNKIEAIRVYNASVSNSRWATRTNGNEPSTMGTGSGNVSGDAQQNNGFIGEDNLVGMPENSHLLDNQTQIILPTGNDLSVGERYTSSQIKENIEFKKSVDILNILRSLICFIGLMIIVYGMVFLLCTQIDAINTWVDISFLSIITFGKVKLQTVPSKITPKGYTTLKRARFVSIILMIAGLVVVSGAVTRGITKVLYELSDKFV